ncbi:MAG: bifunctional phosphopantothenoylcysteine decarboxylase/phosphopantothenate synthase [Bacteroidota bacterium]
MNPQPAADSRQLAGKRLLLGVTGSIAAYKAAGLVRAFKKAGAEVQVLMTPDAARFITPLTLGTLSEREVLVEIFPEGPGGSSEGGGGSWTKHVHLGLWADLFVVAPATATTLSKLAHGVCDSMLTAAVLSARCPLLVCPAMDHDMWLHPATQRNLRLLREDGVHILDPEHGELASGLIGQGRLPEPEAIAAHVATLLAEEAGDAPSPASFPLKGHEAVPLTHEGDSSRSGARSAKSPQNGGSRTAQTLVGKTVLVTAGPTREPIDPVRFLSNPSTGTMGYTLAAAAAARGGAVTLVSGPTALDTPPGVTRIDVTTAAAMHAAAMQHADADLVIAAAAVADYTPADPSPHKRKKEADRDEVTLRLRRTPDILAAIGAQKRPGQTLVGFALETQDGLANAQAKLARKHLDWIVLNFANEEGAGFGTGTNRVTLLGADGTQHDLPRADKASLAGVLLDHVIATAGESA